jgi:molybdopterin/thiamine biosynthesis adenylyltransferase
LTVAVVGVGGAGSLLVQGLAHLGVGRLILVDPDTIETSNLNRLVGAHVVHAERRAAKVTVAAEMVERVDPGINVLAVQSSVLEPKTWSLLRCADLLLGAVDGNAPRWALNALAVQYARTYIDVAAEITTGSGGVLDVAGHVATVTPDGPCLLCLDGYDPRRVGDETNPDCRRAGAMRASGYLADAPEQPTPAVVFLNQAVTAVALGEVVNHAAGWRPVHPYVLIDLTTPATTAMVADRRPGCPACGTDSVRGLGDVAGVPLSGVCPAGSGVVTSEITASEILSVEAFAMGGDNGDELGSDPCTDTPADPDADV